MKYKRKTKEEIATILKRGAETDFWDIMKTGIDENIELLEIETRKEELRKLPAEQYKFENELLKIKIDYLKYLKELPDLIAEAQGTPDNSIPDYDPYAH